MMQLNPFALPSETQGRFRMLVVAALAAALNIGVALTLLVGREDEFQRLRNEYGALLGQVADSTFFKLPLAERERLAKRADVLIQTMLGICLGKLLIPLLYVSILSALAVLIYRRHPQRIRRQFRALPLTAENAPTVERDVNRMVEALNLSPPPSLEHSQGTAKLLEAQAFGLKKSPALLLKGSPELLEQLWDDKYRAVALHELAHIEEGDAQIREGTRAVWLALLVLGYLPLALVILAGGFYAGTHGSARPLLRPIGILSAQLALSSLIVLGIMTGLVRIRELYADWRVAFGGLREPLIAAFGPSCWWHPPKKARQANLERPEKLFRISSGLPLQVGLLLALVLGHGLGFGLLLLQTSMLLGRGEQWHVFASLVEQPTGWKSSLAIVAPIALGNVLPLLAGALLFFFVARMVSGTLDLQVQREAVADLATGKHSNWGYLQLLRPACLLAIGFEAGLLLALGRSPISSSQGALWLIPFRATAMTLLAWVWLVSMRAFSRFYLGSHAGPEPPKLRRAAWFSVLVFTLLCCPLGVASFGFQVFQNTSTADLQSAGLPHGVYYFYYLGAPILWILLGSLILYVLVAGSALVQISRSLFKKVWHCHFCDERTDLRLVVGRICQTCSRPLSPWLYLLEADRLQKTSVESDEPKP
jgi:Zn-dependent protease with chaperone function